MPLPSARMPNTVPSPSPFMVSTAAWNSGIRTVQALKGKRVGVPGPGGFGLYSVAKALEKGGLTLKDVQLVNPLSTCHRSGIRQRRPAGRLGALKSLRCRWSAAGLRRAWSRTTPLAPSWVSSHSPNSSRRKMGRCRSQVPWRGTLKAARHWRAGAGRTSACWTSWRVIPAARWPYCATSRIRSARLMAPSTWPRCVSRSSSSAPRVRWITKATRT